MFTVQEEAVKTEADTDDDEDEGEDEGDVKQAADEDRTEEADTGEYHTSIISAAFYTL